MKNLDTPSKLMVIIVSIIWVFFALVFICIGITISALTLEYIITNGLQAICKSILPVAISLSFFINALTMIKDVIAAFCDPNYWVKEQCNEAIITSKND